MALIFKTNVICYNVLKECWTPAGLGLEQGHQVWEGEHHTKLDNLLECEYLKTNIYKITE